MEKILNFINNKEPLKIGIMNYEESEIDIMSISDDYYDKHKNLLKRPKEKKDITKREFWERLYNYIWIQKVSELIVYLYLEDLNGG